MCACVDVCVHMCMSVYVCVDVSVDECSQDMHYHSPSAYVCTYVRTCIFICNEHPVQ